MLRVTADVITNNNACSHGIMVLVIIQYMHML